jgi:hypothetical protein
MIGPPHSVVLVRSAAVLKGISSFKAAEKEGISRLLRFTSTATGPIRLAPRLTARDAFKQSGQHDSHQQASRSKSERLRCPMEVELSHAAYEHTSDYQIECAVEHVDRWRGLFLAEQGGEDRREPTPGHAVREMWHRVHEKNAREEVTEISLPLHDSPLHFDSGITPALAAAPVRTPPISAILTHSVMVRPC